MISDAILMYFIGMMILLIINVMSITKIPFLAIIGILGTLLLAPFAIIAFGEYQMIAFILVLTNIIIPTMSINSARKGG